MNKFAQLAYGKVIYVYETELTKDDLPRIFQPSTYWVDVTGQDVAVGDVTTFDENLGIVFTRHEQEVSEKEKQLAQCVAQYKADKAEILEYYADAMIHGDTELMAELAKEMTALDEQYATDYEALKEGE